MSLSRFAGQFNAIAFAYGAGFPDAPTALTVIAGSGVSGASALTTQGSIITLSDGRVVTPLATNAPIIVGTGANLETVTPSAVTNNLQSNLYGTTSSVTATYANGHSAGDRISSGTVGLQEAINFANAAGGGTVIVDGSWALYGGTQAMLSAAVLPSNGSVSILDLRTGAGTAQSVTVVIPAATVDTMFTTPVTLVAAPGAGNAIDVIDMVVEAVFGSSAFTGGGAIQASYGTGVTTPATATIAATFLTTFSANQMAKVAGTIAASTASTAVVNQAVTLTNATAVFAAGTGASLIVKLYYRTLTGL
jgi:hypothetical protein